MDAARWRINAADGPLRRLLVAGEPLHAWMIAARLARALRADGVEVVVLEDDAEPEAGLLCLDADIHAFHRALGVDGEGLLRHLRASLRYGSRFIGWSAPEEGGFVGFGSVGRPIGRVPFQHYVTALRAIRPEARLADYSPAARVARAGRFTLGGQGPLAGVEAGLTVEAGDYAAFLRAFSRDLGVTHVVGTLQAIERDADGALYALLLDDGRRIGADWFFDCGKQAAIAGAGRPTTRRAWPADVTISRRERWRAKLDGPTPLFDEIVRRDEGWDRVRCVPGSMEVERVWTTDEPRSGGICETPWHGRVIALGPALGETIDLVADRWWLTRRAMEHWLRLLPTREHSTKRVDEFNRVVVAEAVRLADAQCLPLLCAADASASRPGAPRVDEVAATDSRYRASLYRSSGRLAFHEDDPLSAPRWMMLLEAFGVLPGAVDHLLPTMPPLDLARRMDQIVDALTRSVAGLPVHDEVVGGAREPVGARA